MSDLAERLSTVVDPFTGLTLGDLDAVSDVADAAATVTLPAAAYPELAALEAAIHAAAADASVTIRRPPKYEQPAIIAVGSGKGGVGKSTVAAALSYGLQELGAAVGLMDADVYGPSIPHMLGATGKPAVIQTPVGDGKVAERMVPVERDGLKVMSMGFMVEPDQAVVWRGPMLHRALTQFLQQTAWGDLDYLVVDMPPGTGDVALTLSQQAGLAGAVVVCTPQRVALLDAGKAISMYGQVNIPLLGVVENMTGEMFGRGGAKAKAESMGVDFLGEVPAAPSVREWTDAGEASKLLAADSPVREALLTIAANVSRRAALAERSRVELPSLEGGDA